MLSCLRRCYHPNRIATATAALLSVAAYRCYSPRHHLSHLATMPSNEGVHNGSNPAASSPVRVLVIGGSYAGLAATVNLLDFCHGRPSRFAADPKAPPAEMATAQIPVEITIVDERDGYYHLIGSPLALASQDFSHKAWVRFDDIPALRAQGVSLIQGSADSVDCSRKVATITDSRENQQLELGYDYLIAGSGLRRVWPVVPQALARKDYLSETQDHIDAVKGAADGVVIIGGGAVGIEMAAELKMVEPTLNVTLIHSRERLLSSEPLPDDFKDQTLTLLRDGGVNVVLGQRVIDTVQLKAENGSSYHLLTLSNGTKITAGHVISAISKSVPSTTYLPPAAVNAEGYVKINSNLNFIGDIENPLHHFAVGDIVAWSGIKRCGGAMAMGHLAAENIHQQLSKERFGTTPKYREFPQVPPMIGLAVGKTGISYSPDAGTNFGEDVLEMFFGNDLGYSICWNYMQLSNDDYSIKKKAATIAEKI